MKHRKTTSKLTLTGAAMVMAITSSAFAQEKPYTQPGLGQPVPPPPPPKVDTGSTTNPAPATAIETNAVEKFFNVQIPDALARGKFSLNSRLRYEYVNMEGNPAITDDSHAPTIRTRFGYTTASLYGFQAMVEGENVSVIGPYHNYNAAGVNGVGYKPVVADPRTTELNQGWLSYSYTNWVTVKGGRQRIVLDNHRFIGDVGWRQNMQTFDALTAASQPLKDLNLFYGYVWDVNRIYGNVDGLAFGNRDFESDSHLFNIAYSGCKYGRLVGYAYLLDLENRGGLPPPAPHTEATGQARRLYPRTFRSATTPNSPGRQITPTARSITARSITTSN